MEEKKFAQIAFEFDASHTPAPTPIEQKAEDLPLNIGIRIKALKDTGADIAANSEPVHIPLPAKTKSTRGRKSLKEAGADVDLLRIPDDETLFSRQYFAIGEVASMFRVNTSLIRFWEKEFDILQPRKNRKGDRHFRPVDIKNLQLIYDLLRRRKMTIEGAKDFLKQNKKATERFDMIESLRKMKGFLLEIKASL